jgi:hypothetical protein
MMLNMTSSIKFGRIVQMPNREIADEIGMTMQQNSGITYYVAGYTKTNMLNGQVEDQTFLTTDEDAFVAASIIKAYVRAKDSIARSALQDALISYIENKV